VNSTLEENALGTIAGGSEKTGAIPSFRMQPSIGKKARPQGRHIKSGVFSPWIAALHGNVFE